MINRILNVIITIAVGTTILQTMGDGLDLVKHVCSEPKPHKQTYLEYVQERLEVERMMR